MKRILLLLFLVPFINGIMMAENDPTAKEIIQKADEKMRGESNIATIKMTIIRPTWEREMTLKSWAKGTEYSLTLVTAPARDKGTAFLKREKEIWNWQPTIDRTIKMPPSMMMQSWMGSDFTNDDLVRESSIVTDYEHELLGTETLEGRNCYKIKMTPKPDAPVVWGEIIIWISKDEYLQLKSEFYDEDGYLVQTIYGKQVREMDGRVIPSVLEVVPADEEGHKTRLEYLSLDFNEPIQPSFFSIQNMKRVK
ncbi:outer membrane lipoprotein-sorting protein [Phaeodactylibacter sp.]|jgi:outer membrane lipoprotein-sorting protein|uniref:outer membrane lipoprotein-sorting protein n=1 Tax=Phaeodactylibacter sp. TaxID=1940289 RepID=UPI0025E7C70D|nr:outer membrane lipoprotein-sorting protein [Phaeodactylibacter sp.]MCI4651265.1 outer membrane lipoprotein-sorting protein [Phaeodactylibacter sp.]MCI5093242.1 outer membrane lipoprotein-sorting protein [Phaeodactylibacter sp.]